MAIAKLATPTLDCNKFSRYAIDKYCGYRKYAIMTDEADYLEPAHSIITKLGGLDATAEAAGVHPSRVCRWRLPRDRDGCDGIIPGRHHQNLLDWAASKKIDLRPKDFFLAVHPKRRRARPSPRVQRHEAAI